MSSSATTSGPNNNPNTTTSDPFTNTFSHLLAKNQVDASIHKSNLHLILSGAGGRHLVSQEQQQESRENNSDDDNDDNTSTDSGHEDENEDPREPTNLTTTKISSSTRHHHSSRAAEEAKLQNLLELALRHQYEPSYYHIAYQYEILSNYAEAKKWYQRSKEPHACFRLAKLLMRDEESERKRMEERYLMAGLMREQQQQESGNLGGIFNSGDNNIDDENPPSHSRSQNVKLFITNANDEIESPPSDTDPSQHPHSKSNIIEEKNSNSNRPPPFTQRQRRIVKLLKMAASHGHEEAFYELGLIYANRNWIKSFQYLRTALKSGWTLALSQLSKERDSTVMERLEKDVVESIEISESEQFQYLGFAYQYGYGRKQDMSEALKMFRQAWQYEEQEVNQNSLTKKRPLLDKNLSTSSFNSQSRKRKNPRQSTSSLPPGFSHVPARGVANRYRRHHYTQEFLNLQTKYSSVSQTQIHTLIAMHEVFDEVEYILKRFHTHRRDVRLRRLERQEKQNNSLLPQKNHDNTPVVQQSKQVSLVDLYADPEFEQVKLNIKRKVGVSWSVELGRAKNLLKRLISEGHKESAFITAELYSGDYPGIQKNIKLATELYKASAVVGHVESMFRYANNVLNEFEWTEDPKLLREAVSYYKKAAKLQHAPSMCNLANLYERGLVTGELDYQRAAHLYHEAVKLGDPAAANGLAVLYMHGNGVPRNYMKTAKYLFEAIDHGDEDAKDNMQLLCSDPEGLRAMNLALDAFRYLSAQGNHEANRYELRLQAELGYKQHWESNDPKLVPFQKHMSQLHFEDHGAAVEFNGFSYYTVTCNNRYYILKAFPIQEDERTVDNPIWNAFRAEVVPLIQLRHENFLPVLNWAADIDNVYLMSDKMDIDFHYLLMRSRWDYAHDISMSADGDLALVSVDSLIGLTIAPRDSLLSEQEKEVNEELKKKMKEARKNKQECVYDTDQKLDDLIAIAKILQHYHETQNMGHGSIMARNIYIRSTLRLQRLYHSKNFVRNAKTIGNDREVFLLGECGMAQTTKLLNRELSSYAWSAPEVIRDAKYAQKTSDVFSFGMLMYEFLTHTPPFGEYSNKFTVQNKIMRGETPDIPVEVRQFKGTNFFVAHMISIMMACWSDSRSRLTLLEVIQELESVKTRIAVHRSKASLQPLFTELKLEQYLERFAAEMIMKDQLVDLSNERLLNLFNKQAAPCSRLRNWIKLERERLTPKGIFGRLLVRRKRVRP